MKIVITALLVISLWGCVESSVDTNEQSEPAVTTTDLTTTENLSVESEYQVVNKLLGTLYKGTPVQDFFNIKEGLEQPVVNDQAVSIEAIRLQLESPDEYYSSYIERVNDKYFYDEGRLRNTRSYPMAVLYELPLSTQYYSRWMAYFLTNTILFSPGYELESVDHTDVESVYNNLVFMLDENRTTAEIIYSHMISEENWRRFRSPEDNTREMMEIYLHQFIDDEVPKASTACQNWYLTDGNEGYQLRKGLNINSTPQQSLLGHDDIVSCNDFYKALSEHPNLIPNITRILVSHLFAGTSASDQSLFTERLLASNPTTFKEIFDKILFSEEYLLGSSRTKTYEETVLGTASRMDWYAGRDFFYNLTDGNPGDTPTDLSEINQNPLSYKLGRSVETPLDSLSFAYYHKSVRDQLLLDRRTSTDPSYTYDGGWRSGFIEGDELNILSDQDFVRYLFLSVLARQATAEEIADLENLFVELETEGNRLEMAMISLDYFSRLSELYILPSAQ